MATFPYVLSPYLRSVLRDGMVMYDNGITGELVLPSPLEDEVIRALWMPPNAEIRFVHLCEQRGTDAVLQAVGRLVRDRMVFSSAEQCEDLFDEVLDRGLPDTPFIDQIELTNRCPMTCGFCPRGVVGKLSRPEGDMSLELYARLLVQMHPEQARYRFVELHHLGESLLHPEVARFVELATEQGIPSEMSVNPSLLRPPLGRGLLRAGIRRLVLSLDGMSDEVSTALRGPAARYGAAERNIDALIEAAAERERPPQIVIQMLTLERNRDERERFLQRWSLPRVPFVTAYLKPLEGPDPDLGREVGRQQIYLCSYPWRSVVVLCDGRVVPCCRDADADLVLGDLREQSLREIWHGPRAQALRKCLRRHGPPEGHLCHRCRWSRRRFADAIVRRHPDHAQENPLQW